MAGKITTVLTKKEAETYRAQGLHQEAIDLYVRLLATCPNMDPDIKAAIQVQIDGLSQERESFVHSRSQPLGAAEITRIREGWGERANPTELLICAQAFFQIGAFQEALAEYGRLLNLGMEHQKLADPIAECLTRCHPPGELPGSVSALCRNRLAQPGEALAFQLLLIKPLSRHPDHALTFYRFLREQQGLPPLAAAHLDAAIDRLASAERFPPKTLVSSVEAPGVMPPRRGWRKWIPGLGNQKAVPSKTDGG